MYSFVLIVAVVVLGIILPIIVVIRKKLSMKDTAPIFAATGTVILAIITYRSYLTSEELAKLTLNQPRFEINSFTTDSLSEGKLAPYGSIWWVDTLAKRTKEPKRFLKLKIINTGKKAATPNEISPSTCEIFLKLTVHFI